MADFIGSPAEPTVRSGRRDPLLDGMRICLTALAYLAAGAAVVAIIAIPLCWFARDRIVPDGTANTPAVMAAISVMILACAIIAGLSAQFLRYLVRIIDSVASGSPFIAVNAVRLRRMGWLAVAIEAVSLVVMPLGVWVDSIDPHKDISISVDFAGIITALLLFVLARVFETGAALAEDAAGTV